MMRYAFVGTDTAELWPLLRKGDLLFISTGGHFLSWLVMYATNSPLSHAAIYTGNGEIAHMTTSGFAKEKVLTLEDDRTLILPMFIPAIANDRRDAIDNLTNDMHGMRYGWSAVLIKAIRIIIGRDPDAYRIKFLGDALFLALFLEGVLLTFSSSFLFVWGFVAYVLLVTICFLIPGHYHTLTPARLYKDMRDQGARVIQDRRNESPHTSTTVATEMQVFLRRRIPVVLDDLKSGIELMGLTMAHSVVQQVSLTEADVTLVMGSFEGRFRATYGDFEAEAARLNVPPDLGLTECLTVRASSVEPSDILAGVVFACAFAFRHSGYYVNMGLNAGFSPEQSLGIAKSLVESGVFTVREVRSADGEVGD